MALAAVLVGQMFSLSSQVAQISIQLKGGEGQMLNFSSQMFNLSSQMFNLNSQMLNLNSQVLNLNSQMLNLNSKVDLLLLRVEGVENITSSILSSVTGLLAATLTPAAAQTTLECAKASVYSLFLWRNIWDSTQGALERKLCVCSAFAYMELQGGDTLAVSASHCFENISDTTFDATRLALPWNTRVACRLLKVLTGDAAVLRCKDASPLLMRTSAPPVFAQAVVAAGFSADSSGIQSVYESIFMHVAPSRIAVSMGPLAVAKTLAGGGALLHNAVAAPPPLAPIGMLQGMLLQGMSGGPVLDVHCGVVGIISSASTNSAFTMLDEVDAWLQREQWEE